MAKQFLDLHGLETFLTQLNGLFATKSAVTEVKDLTDNYIFGTGDIDYFELEFDIDQIILNEE